MYFNSLEIFLFINLIISVIWIFGKDQTLKPLFRRLELLFQVKDSFLRHSEAICHHTEDICPHTEAIYPYTEAISDDRKLLLSGVNHLPYTGNHLRNSVNSLRNGEENQPCGELLLRWDDKNLLISGLQIPDYITASKYKLIQSVTDGLYLVAII